MPIGTGFRVRTQVPYPTGRPDLVLDAEAAGLLLLIECKLEAGEGPNQLQTYQQITKASLVKHVAILFLTKYYEPDRQLPGLSYMRWHQLFGFVQQLPPPVSEIVTLFSDYLIYHRLHHTMSFTAADLLALEQIAATTAKMDEVLYNVEWLFRDKLGSTYQHTKSRSAHLAEGWYGYWRDLHGVVYAAGFRGQGPDGLPSCFVSARSWNAFSDAVAVDSFQHSLRSAWNISNQPLDKLEVSQSLVKFLASDDSTPLEAMREWFKKQFTALNDTLAKYPQMLDGNTEPGPAALTEQAEVGDDEPTTKEAPAPASSPT
jgi:hypothetical protein